LAASTGFSALERKLGQLHKEMSGEAARKALVRVGVDAKKDALQALKADLGDTSMSGWWKPTAKRPNRKPIEIATAFNVVGDTELQIVPRGASAGPWRVLEEGRKASSKGDTYTYSKRRFTKSKGVVVSDYTRRRKRNSGSTPAKNTWSEAAELMIERTPKRVHTYFVVEPMTRLFTR
jgi:hypothetical protein